jgi:hypothetical protein
VAADLHGHAARYTRLLHVSHRRAPQVMERPLAASAPPSKDVPSTASLPVPSARPCAPFGGRGDLEDVPRGENYTTPDSRNPSRPRTLVIGRDWPRSPSRCVNRPSRRRRRHR